MCIFFRKEGVCGRTFCQFGARMIGTLFGDMFLSIWSMHDGKWKQ